MDHINETGNIRSKSQTAFIVELFMLFVLLILVIVVITEVLVMTRGQSLKAMHLNDAVITARNTAEAARHAGDAETLADEISSMENAGDVKRSGNEVTFVMSYDGSKAKSDRYDVNVIVNDEKTRTGKYVAATIKVSLAGDKETLYTLDSADYQKEGD